MTMSVMPFSSDFSIEPGNEEDGQSDTSVVSQSQDDISVNEGDEKEEYIKK